MQNNLSASAGPLLVQKFGWRQIQKLARLCALQAPLAVVANNQSTCQCCQSRCPTPNPCRKRVYFTSETLECPWPLPGFSLQQRSTHVAAKFFTSTTPPLPLPSHIPPYYSHAAGPVGVPRWPGRCVFLFPTFLVQSGKPGEGETTGWGGCSCWFVFISSRPPPLLCVVQRQQPCAVYGK